MASAPALPRRLGFRGAVEASAWGFSDALFSESALRERVWSLWGEGARLEAFDWGHVLHLPRAVRVRVEEAPGIPLVQSQNALVSAPSPAGEAPNSGVWIVEGGEWRELRDGRMVDVSLWIDVGAWEVEESVSLGEIAPIPVALAPIALDLRAQSGIGAPDAKWKTVWERGDSPARFEFEPALWLRQLSRVLTPTRIVDGKMVASAGSIVLSAALLLGGASLFTLLSLVHPQSAPGFSFALLLVAGAILGAAWLWQTKNKIKSPFGLFVAPFFAASNLTQRLALAILLIGIVRLFFASPGDGANVLIWSVWTWMILRVSGLMSRLVGSAQTGTGKGAGGQGWLARWVKQNAGTQGTAPAGAAGALWARLFGKKGEGNGQSQPSLGDAWRRFLAQLALETGLFKHLSRAQARFLMRSMELFERGDLEAALRHALPLGGAGTDRVPPPALGVPNARDSLAISPLQRRASGTMNFGPELEAKLRALYRKAFERLRDANDVDRAAFVLAELLQNSAEAVTFLETHGQLELSARIAEARHLPPGLVVRAWWLAGDRPRAIALAKLHGAFADAVLRLERDPKQKSEALSLRLLWANELAEAGRFGAAIEALGAAPEGAALARRWLRLGLERDSSNTKLLACALQLEPAAWQEWQPMLQALWRSGEEGAAANRARFARELVKTPATQADKPVLQIAARASIRALVGDAAQSAERLDKGDWEKLQALANDGILCADVRLPSAPKASLPVTPVEIRVEASEGALVPTDAVWLESGELLVALGEAGAQLRGRDGKVKAHFDVPAHQIVRSFEGNRVLLLAPRDDSTRVSKLDVGTRKAAVWGDLRLERSCHSFNGTIWFVASEGRVRALDVSAPSPASLWDCGDMDGKVIDMALAPGSLCALVSHIWSEGFVLESWRFDSSTLVLRERRRPSAFPAPTQLTSMRRVFANAEQFAVSIKPKPSLTQDAPNETPFLFWQRDDSDTPIEEAPLEFFDAVTSSNHAMILWRSEGGSTATLFDNSSAKVMARLRFPDAARLGARECDEIGKQWLVWDNLGRVVLFDSATGAAKREWSLA